MLNINKEMTGERTAILKLEGDVGIETVEALRDTLLEGLRDLDHLMLNCERTASFDFFALQLICSAHRSAVNQGKLLTWQGSIPPAAQKAVKSLGFSRTTGCDLCPDGVCCMWV